MLLLKYMRINLMASMEYKVAFSLTMLGRILSAFLEVIALFFLFERFDSLLNYSFGEVGICYLVIRLSFAIAHSTATGFQRFWNCIREGKFDSILLRPRSIILQVFGNDLEPNEFGVAIQYAVMLILFASGLDIGWTVGKVITLILMVLSGTAIFTGIFIIAASFCFYSVKGLEFVNIFTDGGVKMASYPLTIYSKWITGFFTFLVPFGCANYLPLLYLSGKPGLPPAISTLSPLFGFAFLIPSFLIWKRAVKHYASTGS